MGESADKLGEGKYLRLVRYGRWEFVERVKASGVVVVVPLTDDDHILFIEQSRRAIERASIELPAGLAGDVDDASHESLETAARRELFEETGYEAEHMEWLAEAPSSAGLTSEMITYFKATGLKQTGPGGGDHSEDITLHKIPLAACRRWLDEQAAVGRPVASMAYAGLYLLLTDDQRRK